MLLKQERLLSQERLLVYMIKTTMPCKLREVTKPWETIKPELGEVTKTLTTRLEVFPDFFSYKNAL